MRAPDPLSRPPQLRMEIAGLATARPAPVEPVPPPRARLIVGYSGWGPGQLEEELQASAWLMSDIDRDVIFNTPPEKMWEMAIRRLGADPSTLQMSRGVH